MSVPDRAPMPPTNRLLAALPAAERQSLLPYLEAAPLAARQVLYQPGQLIPYVYFPTGGVLSLLTVMRRGRTIEVGMVGREGMAGLPVFLGSDAASSRCMVQVPGEALRMPADAFRARAATGRALHGLLLRYTHAVLAQLGQAAACNSLHPVEQRCCRWLLLTHDLAGADEFPLTHELLAAMLGVRRASVTEVAQGLQKAGLIRCGRGRVAVLDRRGLEAASCECYGVIQAESDWLP